MGMFDEIVDGVKNNLPEGVREKLEGNLPAGDHNAVLGMATTLFEGFGGLGGIVQRFQGSGLGDVAQSWIGKGDNLPVTGEQVQQALGSDTISHLAGQLGMDPHGLSQKLAQYLPLLVDHLTPNGQLPQGPAASISKEQPISAAMGLFKQRQ